MAQGANGRVEIFEDFLAGEDIVAETAASRSFGSSGLRVIGQGIAEPSWMETLCQGIL